MSVQKPEYEVIGENFLSAYFSGNDISVRKFIIIIFLYKI